MDKPPKPPTKKRPLKLTPAVRQKRVKEAINHPAQTAPQATDPLQIMDPPQDTAASPSRRYLDETVAPVLLRGLKVLADERPNDPVKYLAEYLLKNNNHAEKSQQDD